MRRLPAAAAGLILLLLVAGTLSAAPRLEIPETTFNFGYAPQHAKISHDFWLRSSGDDTLRILRVVPG